MHGGIVQHELFVWRWLWLKSSGPYSFSGVLTSIHPWGWAEEKVGEGDGLRQKKKCTLGEWGELDRDGGRQKGMAEWGFLQRQMKRVFFSGWKAFSTRWKQCIRPDFPAQSHFHILSYLHIIMQCRTYQRHQQGNGYKRFHLIFSSFSFLLPLFYVS